MFVKRYPGTCQAEKVPRHMPGIEHYCQFKFVTLMIHSTLELRSLVRISGR